MDKLQDSFSALSGFLKYSLRARHRSGHGIHSPAAYEFVAKVVCDNSSYSDFNFFKQARQDLNISDKYLLIEDVGATSRVFKQGRREVSKLNKYSSIPAKYGRLLYRIVKHYNLKQLVEFGTSIGVSAMYLAKGIQDGKLLSYEGNKALCLYAAEWHKEKSLNNICIENMTFSEALATIDARNIALDLAFIDGDHQYKSTMECFSFFKERIKEGFIIIDDINWSTEMRKAWGEIVSNNKCYVTFDMYKLGIVMLRDSITPGAFTLRY